MLLPHEARDHLTDNGIHAFSANVTKDDDVHKLRGLIDEVTDGGLDVLVNNA